MKLRTFTILLLCVFVVVLLYNLPRKSVQETITQDIERKADPYDGLDPSADPDEEYLLFLVQDTYYHVDFGSYGIMKLSEVPLETINNLRYVYDPEYTIIFQDLRINPEEIHQGENTTIRFNITNKQEKDAMVGFIIEHHPPPYQTNDEENRTLKYLQYAKSVNIPSKTTITYEYILSSNYNGVNTVEINYQGGSRLTDTFIVTRFSNFMGNPETVIFEVNSIVYYLPLLLMVGVFILGAILRTSYQKPPD